MEYKNHSHELCKLYSTIKTLCTRDLFNVYEFTEEDIEELKIACIVFFNDDIEYDENEVDIEKEKERIMSYMMEEWKRSFESIKNKKDLIDLLKRFYCANNFLNYDHFDKNKIFKIVREEDACLITINREFQNFNERYKEENEEENNE